MVATGFTMLDSDETRRRIVAGRELRGLTQDELGALFEQDGLGKHDPGRIERGTKAMQAAHRRAFIAHLRLPETWFTEHDVDKLIAHTPPPADVTQRLDAIAEAVGELLARTPALDQRDAASLEAELGAADEQDDTLSDSSEEGRRAEGGRP